MTTLVTGAFGCIGAWVIRGRLAAGERPVAFDLGDDPWRVRMIAGPDAIDRVVLPHRPPPSTPASGRRSTTSRACRRMGGSTAGS